ncbi:peptide chain release factor N(5)-glutamine methyltransferase [Niveibacterium terrae]|uniref:peptide chain release factor N(5)-glutamine methyltransferase n=1 Tax=Niveibacterium terrae TaxID=3373598 RepID=UPI003A92AA5B
MTLPTTYGEAIAAAQPLIGLREARVLLREAAGASAAAVQAFPERALAPEAARRFTDWVARRAAGEPVAYLLGAREFYGRMFGVGPEVLIPRPETELLVELALAKAAEFAAPRLLDLGTGSGAIAITLALEAPGASVAAVEYSAAALARARANAEALAARIDWYSGCWLAPLGDRTFDVIVSNPPYIRAGDHHLGEGDLRFEPGSALSSGPDGLADIRTIIAGAPAHLARGGWLLFEHGYDQAEPVRALLAEAGFSAVESVRDLAGIERASLGRLEN